MNTYRIIGTYQLWDNPTISRENFKCLIVAEDTEQALQACKDEYREAEIDSFALQERDVVVAGDKMLRDRLAQQQKDIDFLYAQHPRAMKLISKGKPFIVIAEDEPYYIDAYKMIREREIAIGRWNNVDEALFQKARRGE